MPSMKDLLRQKLFSERRREVEGKEEMDYYIFDQVPVEARNKFCYVVQDTFEILARAELIFYEWNRSRVHNLLRDVVLRKYGFGQLPGGNLFGYIHQCGVDELLDFLELFLTVAINCVDHPDNYTAVVNAQDRINHIFKEHKLGYEMVNGQVVRVDSLYLHQEVVKEAITLLHAEGFDGPLGEFQKAIELYDKGERFFAEAITNANKAFESTMKAICEKHGIPYDPDRDTAKMLISKMYEHGFLMPYLQQFSDHFRLMMESGLPTVRSREGAHGAGLDPKEVSRSITRFALHLAGTFIVFLIQRHREKISS